MRYLEKHLSVWQLCWLCTMVYNMSVEVIPGASLKERKPEQLKVPELKRWLSCRGAPYKSEESRSCREES